MGRFPNPLSVRFRCRSQRFRTLGAEGGRGAVA